MDDDQQFCLRWNNHQSTLISVFDTLLENETLVDCTLAAEGKFLKAHKVVLSACSPYFATLLQEQYDKHPIFILKDVKYQELRAMMDYMYRGEVNISQDQLAALLKAAESLQIKGLSDNRSGGSSGTAAAAAAAQAAPKPDSHHRVKLSGTYTLEQTKRARIATGGGAVPMDAGDVSGSREGSSSPSRRRRKVRRRSMENDMHDNSNSSVLQAASNQSILQQTSASLTASALVSTQLASGSSAANAAVAAATNAACGSSNSSSQVSNQPLTSSSSNVTKKTESAKLTSTAAQGAQQQQQQQQTTTTSDAINTDNVQQQQQQQQNQDAQGDADEMDVASGAGVASGTVAVHTGVVKQLTTLDKSNHKQKIKDNSITTELVIEPKAEYDEDAHDENVEDLTLDEEDMTMEELDQAAGTSQGGEGSSQAYATWQHDRSQDELGLMAAQDAQQRDPQDLSITRIAGLTWNEWNARLAMPLVTLREGVQPLVFPTDLSVDKQMSIASSKAASVSDASEHSKTPSNSIRLKIEPGAASTPRNSSEKQHKTYPGGGKLKHLSEEEATALMLKAVAEKQAAAAAGSNNSSDRGYGEENLSSAGGGGGNGNSNDYPATLSGAVTFADVGGPAGLCHLNILNSISAMNNLISGNTSAGGSGGNGAAGGSSSLSVSLNSSGAGGAGGSNNNSVDNGAGHPCPVCGRVYKLKSSLRNHQKWECGKEPQFQCPFCVYRAKQKMHIGRHMERMHKEKFQLEDDKSFITSIIGSSIAGGNNSNTDSDNNTTAAAAVAAAAAAAGLASVAELQTHFT